MLADLVIDPVDASGLMSSKLKHAGIDIPFYVVSSAVDALVGNVDLRELGVSGVFLKPVDSAVSSEPSRPASIFSNHPSVFDRPPSSDVMPPH